jgi:hypothetical protein
LGINGYCHYLIGGNRFDNLNIRWRHYIIIYHYILLVESGVPS